jgi:hypothetical protein
MLTNASFTDGLIAVPMNMIGIGRANDAGGKRYAITKAMLNAFAALADVGVDARRHIPQQYLTNSAVVYKARGDTTALAGRCKR